MNYLVCIKQVPDTTTRIQLTDSFKEVDFSNIKWIINPYDEFAIEEAHLLAKKDIEKGERSKVFALSAGPGRVIQSLRTALAMGADEAIHLETKELAYDSLQAAAMVFDFLKTYKTKMDFILCGKHSIDSELSLMGTALASFLNIPSVQNVKKVIKNKESFEIHRSLQSNEEEILTIKPPLLIHVTKGINDPKPPSLPAIMLAKNKVLKTYQASFAKPRFQIESFEFPKERPPVQMIEGSPKEQSQKLILLLKKEGVIDL